MKPDSLSQRADEPVSIIASVAADMRPLNRLSDVLDQVRLRVGPSVSNVEDERNPSVDDDVLRRENEHEEHSAAGSQPLLTLPTPMAVLILSLVSSESAIVREYSMRVCIEEAVEVTSEM
jgi:hypothetical protein